MIKANPHNQRLNESLDEISYKVEAARSDKDLVTAINLLSGFPAPVQYDNRFVHTAGILVAIIGLVTALLGFYDRTLPDWFLLAGVALTTISLTGYGLFIWNRRANLSNLSNRIHQKTILFDNDLTEIPSGGKLMARRLGSRFADFNRGNYSREIRYALEGRHEGSEHSFDYRYYHFHYVDKRRETYTTTVNGKTRVRTRTVYDHYDRYAMIIPFGFARSISVVRDRNKHPGERWETASLAFNKTFGVFATSEVEAAKFLTPKIILTIEELSKQYRVLNLQLNQAGDLCLFFTNSDMIDATRSSGLEYPDEFAKEIAGQTSLRKLRLTLGAIHTLMKYSDSNF